MLKEAGILFAITLIAGLLLGFVYELTKEPIRLQEEKAVQEACRAVLRMHNSLKNWMLIRLPRIPHRSYPIPESPSVRSMRHRMLPEHSWVM